MNIHSNYYDYTISLRLDCGSALELTGCNNIPLMREISYSHSEQFNIPIQHALHTSTLVEYYSHMGFPTDMDLF